MLAESTLIGGRAEVLCNQIYYKMVRCLFRTGMEHCLTRNLGMSLEELAFEIYKKVSASLGTSKLSVADCTVSSDQIVVYFNERSVPVCNFILQMLLKANRVQLYSRVLSVLSEIRPDFHNRWLEVTDAAVVTVSQELSIEFVPNWARSGSFDDIAAVVHRVLNDFLATDKIEDIDADIDIKTELGLSSAAQVPDIQELHELVVGMNKTFADGAFRIDSASLTQNKYSNLVYTMTQLISGDEYVAALDVYFSKMLKRCPAFAVRFESAAEAVMTYMDYLASKGISSFKFGCSFVYENGKWTMDSKLVALNLEAAIELDYKVIDFVLLQEGKIYG